MKKSFRRIFVPSVLVILFYTYEPTMARLDETLSGSLCESGTTNEGECDGTYCRWVSDPNGCTDCRVPI